MDVPTPDKWLPVTPDLAAWKAKTAKREIRVGDALDPMRDQAKGAVQKTVAVETFASRTKADVRSPTMAEFFERVERYRGHVAWLKNQIGDSKIAIWLFMPLAWAGGVAAMQWINT
jgi:hypothetical protein